MIASIYAAISISFWGISFVSTKAVLAQLDPFTLLSIRFGIASLFLFFLLLILRQNVKMKIIHLPHVFTLATLGIFVHQVVQAAALQSIQASQAGWIISFFPYFYSCFGFAFFERSIYLIKGNWNDDCNCWRSIDYFIWARRIFDVSCKHWISSHDFKHIELGCLFHSYKKITNSLSSFNSNFLY